jgi:hypothetical protein
VSTGNGSHGQAVPGLGSGNSHWASYCTKTGLESFGWVGWFGVKTDFAPLSRYEWKTYSIFKLLCKVFRENKKLNLELKRSSSEIASLRSGQDDMSAKPCDNSNMIMVNFDDLWLMHSHVASLLDGARMELRELKAPSTLLGACTTYPLVRSNFEASIVEIKDLMHKLDHSSHYIVLSALCEACVSLKDKLFHASKENIKLK